MQRAKNESLISAQKLCEQHFLEEKSQINQEKAQRTASFLADKIAEEQFSLEEQERKLLEFEAREKELMTRLKQTQKLQKDVYEDFSQTVTN